MTIYNKNHPEINRLFQETVKNHDEVRAHIEFAYAHYDQFIKYCEDVASGKKKPYF